jgi:hypothetical protein
VVRVGPRVEDGLFAYFNTGKAETSVFFEPLPARDGVVPPDFGSAERGGFSYSMLMPQEPGVSAIGVYFIEGRLGVLYAPLLRDEPEPYPQVSQEAFVEDVERRHGIELRGFGFGHPA